MKQKLFTLSLVMLGLLCTSASAAIVITEFMYDPSSGQVVGSGSGDDHWEWVEIYNNGGAAVDLQNWQLDDANPGSGGPVTITTSSISINPGAYILLTDQTVGDFNAEWNTALVDDVSLITMTNIQALNNTGDTIRLIDNGATEVFSLTYVNTSPEGWALGYHGDLNGGPSEYELDSNWASARYLTGVTTADSTDLGSPGAYNGVMIPEPSTVVLFLLGGLMINRRLRERYV